MDCLLLSTNITCHCIRKKRVSLKNRIRSLCDQRKKEVLRKFGNVESFHVMPESNEILAGEEGPKMKLYWLVGKRGLWQ